MFIIIASIVTNKPLRVKISACFALPVSAVDVGSKIRNNCVFLNYASTVASFKRRRLIQSFLSFFDSTLSHLKSEEQGEGERKKELIEDSIDIGLMSNKLWAIVK